MLLAGVPDSAVEAGDSPDGDGRDTEGVPGPSMKHPAGRGCGSIILLSFAWRV